MPTPLMRHFKKILAEAPGGEGCAVSPGSAVFDPGVLARSILPDEMAERFRRDGIRSIVNDHETGGSVVCYWLAGRVMIDSIRTGRTPACTPECGEWACPECPLSPNTQGEQRP